MSLKIKRIKEKNTELVESFDPIIAAIEGCSREHVVRVQSIPKNIKTSVRGDGAVNARINETN